ncbi:tripartite tricarboxylate transporter TctB family protein [Aureimonas sp. SA4125]|uniref:tripartite tricarboxylate transporter TctB family protein n=1 Tax=Aureimonas sp. SA4125 TaxID=2826993 RepID=UPI001CC49EEE|nr:tripartite tricarboxylate transporter TctB family protein [Aureimonas sp. SA4125]
MELQKSAKDILSGLIFLGFGAAFAITALGYPMGTALRMGAGFFPFALGLILCVIGLAVLVKGFLHRGPAEDLGTIPWRGAVLILSALTFFGLCVRGLGLLPTLFVTVLASALASRTLAPWAAVALATAMTLICYVIFVRGLGVVVPLFGPWTRF